MTGRMSGASQGFEHNAPSVRAFIVLVILLVRVWRSLSAAEFIVDEPRPVLRGASPVLCFVTNQGSERAWLIS